MTMPDSALVGAGQAVTSCAQDGYWLLDLLVPQTGAYRISRSYKISGYFNVEALRLAWQETVSRHETLRTTFVEVDGRPMQQVGAAADASFVVTDLSEPAGPQAAAERAAASRPAPHRPLTDGPLARLPCSGWPGRPPVVLRRASGVVDESRCPSWSTSSRRPPGAGAGTSGPCPPRPVRRLRPVGSGTLTTPDFARLLGWWTSGLTPLAAGAVVAGGPRSVAPRPSAVVRATRFEWDADVAERWPRARERAGQPLAVMLAAYWPCCTAIPVRNG